MNLFGHVEAAESGGTAIQRTAALAVKLASRRVATYASRFSRRDFTQPQLLACLILRGSMGLTYRGVCDLLHASPVLRETLGLRKVPHFTTLESFANGGQTARITDELLGELLRLVTGADRPAVEEIALDSTGFTTTRASVYYTLRARRHNGVFVKVSLAVVCGLMLPAAMVVSWGRSSDLTQAYDLVRVAAERVQARRLYADGGYESETLHVLCRDELGIESFMPPVPRTRDGTIRTKYRARMTPLPERYGRRSHAEAFFSAAKRVAGSDLRARSRSAMMIEAGLRVLGYAVRR